MEKNKSLEKLTPSANLSQIAGTNEHAGPLLASIGLDPSSYKNKSLQAVCRQKQWSEVEVLQWVKKNCRSQSNKMENAERPEPNFGTNLRKWWHYLEHEKMARTMALLDDLSDEFPRVHQIHGNQYTQLKNIKWYFERFENTFRIYCKYEKEKFYPLALKLTNQKTGILHGTITTLQRGIEIIEEDQQQLHDYLETIQKKSRNFENPAIACSTLRIMNQNFSMLYSALNDQFKIEKERILPLVRKNIAEA